MGIEQYFNGAELKDDKVYISKIKKSVNAIVIDVTLGGFLSYDIAVLAYNSAMLFANHVILNHIATPDEPMDKQRQWFEYKINELFVQGDKVNQDFKKGANITRMVTIPFEQTEAGQLDKMISTFKGSEQYVIVQSGVNNLSNAVKHNTGMFYAIQEFGPKEGEDVGYDDYFPPSSIGKPASSILFHHFTDTGKVEGHDGHIPLYHYEISNWLAFRDKYIKAKPQIKQVPEIRYPYLYRIPDGTGSYTILKDENMKYVHIKAEDSSFSVVRKYLEKDVANMLPLSDAPWFPYFDNKVFYLGTRSLLNQYNTLFSSFEKERVQDISGVKYNPSTTGPDIFGVNDFWKPDGTRSGYPTTSHRSMFYRENTPALPFQDLYGTDPRLLIASMFVQLYGYYDPINKELNGTGALISNYDSVDSNGNIKAKDLMSDFVYSTVFKYEKHSPKYPDGYSATMKEKVRLKDFAKEDMIVDDYVKNYNDSIPFTFNATPHIRPLTKEEIVTSLINYVDYIQRTTINLPPLTKPGTSTDLNMTFYSFIFDKKIDNMMGQIVELAGLRDYVWGLSEWKNPLQFDLLNGGFLPELNPPHNYQRVIVPSVPRNNRGLYEGSTLNMETLHYNDKSESFARGSNTYRNALGDTYNPNYIYYEIAKDTVGYGQAMLFPQYWMSNSTAIIPGDKGRSGQAAGRYRAGQVTTLDYIMSVVRMLTQLFGFVMTVLPTAAAGPVGVAFVVYKGTKLLGENLDDFNNKTFMPYAREEMNSKISPITPVVHDGKIKIPGPVKRLETQVQYHTNNMKPMPVAAGQEQKSTTHDPGSYQETQTIYVPVNKLYNDVTDLFTTKVIEDGVAQFSREKQYSWKNPQNGKTIYNNPSDYGNMAAEMTIYIPPYGFSDNIFDFEFVVDSIYNRYYKSIAQLGYPRNNKKWQQGKLNEYNRFSGVKGSATGMRDFYHGHETNYRL